MTSTYGANRLLRPFAWLRPKLANRWNDAIDKRCVQDSVIPDVFGVLDRVLACQGKFAYLGERHLAAIARECANSADVVVCYNYLAHLVLPGLLAKKVLFQCHPNPAGLRADRFSGCDLSAEGFAVEREFAWGARYRELLENEFSSADLCIAPSSFVADTLLAAGAPPEGIRVVPYGSPSPKPRLGKPGKTKRLIFVGQLTWRKGADLLAPIMRELGSGYHLTVVTRGLCDKAILKSLASQERVSLFRDIPSRTLESMYAGSDALLFPSRYEGYGLVINEALSYGLPVISTRYTALVDVAKQAAVGHVVDSQSPRAYADSIRAVFGISWKALSDAALDWSRQNTWEQFRQDVRKVALEG